MQQHQHPAFDFILQALNDFATTLPPSARQGFSNTANQAAADVRAQLDELVNLKAKENAPPAQ